MSFGMEYAKVWPDVDKSPFKLTDFGTNLLKKCTMLEKPKGEHIAINVFMRKSADFPIQFGTNTCRVLSQPVERYPIIKQHIESAYPIIHERVLGLYLDFLEHKSHYGNSIETRVYSGLSLTDFVQRLLTKRCVCFTDAEDNYVLLSGESGAGGFQTIGKPSQKAPFILENLISYDEMKLSAFLSVSSHTDFINDGRRDNMGRIENDKSKFEQDGVVIGYIGGRFQHFSVMEAQDILITKIQNSKVNGYGRNDCESIGCNNSACDYRRVWNDFYDNKDILFDLGMLSTDPRYFKFQISKGEQMIFDNVMMKKRYAISIDTLLLEAQSRALKAKKLAYVHIVGIGLGVWMLLPQQEHIFLETFAERIKVLLPRLKDISVLHFPWFRYSEWGELKNGGLFESEDHPKGGIKILLSKRNPSEKLVCEYEDCLLVVSYAWDSNSMPGNEFWFKCLGNSNDSSNASSTLVTEIHNPHINTELVNGRNLHIATLNHGVLHIRDYCRFILKLN